ncbi:Na+/H+ antiporter NhaA [Chitinasiproducens palmae]|uniref:Na(+)/H(+) antiporter NhaA n=1 Tax=Chitinasiproducens palmae TaxID=1770053 RepID=A0A1H2PKL0_9BURK|nr:Na+/H+ antiporter NhaA [Chitinasiproducens palmae]SDV46105.1 sodium/proton antiporter, NhaA family [Chitinasiproducens palmae]
MSLPPRKRGQAAVRARHSTFTRHISSKLAPFFAVSEVSGGPLLIATVLALLWVNSPFGHSYHHVWELELGVRFGHAELKKALSEWTQDALLPIFFFGVGIEVKREVVKGLLSERKTAALPVLCALGGMLAPALIYLALNHGGEFRHGWGATVTTDTAFALALVGIFGTRLPRSVRVLLLAFAAVDDIGGLIVIATVYTSHVNWMLLGIAAVLYLVIVGLIRLEIVPSMPYVLLGLAICLLIQQAGVHPTIAGVALGALVPVQPRMPEQRFAEVVQDQVDSFKRAHEHAENTDDERLRNTAADRRELHLGRLSETAEATYEPAMRITQAINPWISWVVLPLFAISNAGVEMTGEVIHKFTTNAVGVGIVVALVLGKPLGMLAFAWLGIKTRLAALPDRMTWRMLVAIGVSSGIGFTLSLFVAELAFRGGEAANEAKLGVLIASVIAAALGYVAFWFAARHAERQDRQEGRDEDAGDDAVADNNDDVDAQAGGQSSDGGARNQGEGDASESEEGRLANPMR